MATPEEFDYPSPEIESPVIYLDLAGERYPLTWYNTLLRKFLTGEEEEYDHLLHQMPDGRRLFLFLNGEDGLELKDKLAKQLYPVRIDPILDNETAELYIRGQMMGLDEEIKMEFS